MFFRRGALPAIVAALTLGGGCDGGESATQATPKPSADVTTTIPKGSGSSTTSLVGKSPAERTVTKNDTGKTVSIVRGGKLVVSLETCGGCGYTWTITNEPDSTVLKLESTEHKPTDTTQPGGPPIAGAPEDTVFTFDALARGAVTLQIGYFPPSDREHPDETFTLNITVS